MLTNAIFSPSFNLADTSSDTLHLLASILHPALGFPCISVHPGRCLSKVTPTRHTWQATLVGTGISSEQLPSTTPGGQLWPGMMLLQSDSSLGVEGNLFY